MVDIIIKVLDFLFARGFDAMRWKQSRDLVKATLEEWHASGAPDADKLAALDAKLADIDAASEQIRNS